VVRELGHWNNHLKRSSKPAELRIQSDSGKARQADQGVFQLAYVKPIKNGFFPTFDTPNIVEEAEKEYLEKVKALLDKETLLLMLYDSRSNKVLHLHNSLNVVLVREHLRLLRMPLVYPGNAIYTSSQIMTHILNATAGKSTTAIEAIQVPRLEADQVQNHLIVAADRDHVRVRVLEEDIDRARSRTETPTKVPCLRFEERTMDMNEAI
jgi:hypothetical protein